MLTALDSALAQDTDLHCRGGFVLAEHYEFNRPTADLDILESIGTPKALLAQLAGCGSALHQRHVVYLDIVTVADVPDHYEARLVPMDVAGLRRLRLKAFERHDLVLAKLCRNIDRDRQDVNHTGEGPWPGHRCLATALSG